MKYLIIVFLAAVFVGALCPAASAGYDLHITRAKEWTESKDTPVPLDDWVRFVKSDSEFRLVTPQDPNDKPKDAIWTDPKSKQEIYFYYSNGEITVKDADERTIAKMKQVAEKLKAKVVGDEGEGY